MSTLYITAAGDDFVLRADAHLMQIILRSSIADLSTRTTSLPHRDLYDRLANEMRKVSPWPLGDKIMDVADMHARMDGRVEVVEDDEIEDLLA